MKEFWNNRYSEDGWAYGSEPNEFIKQQLDKISNKKLSAFFPAEGEGRNSVYAARLGFNVSTNVKSS